MYDISPDGTDSSTKVDLLRRVIRLSFNSTPSGQSDTSNDAGGTLVEAIIRLLFGDICDQAGPFLKFEKNRHRRFTLRPQFSVLKPLQPYVLLHH